MVGRRPSAAEGGPGGALKVLTESAWDGGIITEGVKAETGQPDQAGLAFATAAGYVSHTICEQFCIDRKDAAARRGW